MCVSTAIGRVLNEKTMWAHSVDGTTGEKACLLPASSNMGSVNRRRRFSQPVLSRQDDGEGDDDGDRNDMNHCDRNSHAIIISQLPSRQIRNSENGGTDLAHATSQRHRHSKGTTLAPPRRQPTRYLRRRHTFVLPSTSSRQANVRIAHDVEDGPSDGDGAGSTGSATEADDLEDMGDEELWQQRKSVKCMTTNLTIKRRYRDRVLTQQSRTGTGLYSLGNKSLFRVRSKFHEVVSQFELWARSLKVIEGHFGSAILSYFRFVRLLMLLNIFIAVLLFCVVTLPYLILAPAETFLEYTTAINASSNAFVQLAVDCSTNYSSYVTNKVASSEAVDYVLDILQGTGFMERTVLFYGVYFNKTLPGFTPSLLTSDPFTMVYNMSLAYLVAIGTYFIVSFIFILRQSAAGVKEGLISQESTLTQYCNKVFAGWDFCITDQSKGKLKHKNLRKELEADLYEQQMARDREARSTKQWVKLYIIRFFINLGVFVILGGSLALIYLTNDWSLTLQQREEITDQFLALLVQFLPSITITILNILVPLLFDVMVEPEGYSPAFNIKITLIRTVLLRLASIAILMISLYGQVVDRTGISDAVDRVNAQLCAAISTFNESMAIASCSTNFTVQKQCGNKDFSKIKCWETYVGQQLYKLIVLDFLVVLVTTFFVEFPRKLVYKKFHDKFALVKRFGKQEFDIPKNVLDIVYSQTLCWLGAFFSPLIPFMCMMKCFIFFYIKKLSLLQNCDPPEKPFRASKSNSFFMIVLLLSFIMVAIPIGFMVGRIPPSQSCGPFRIYSDIDYYMFHSLTNLIETFPDLARDIFYFFGSVAFYVPAMILLCLVMYYFWAVAQGYKKMGQLLKDQLVLEGKDKQYLLRQVTDAMTRGQATT